ncbi:MAG: putative addiction module antidote protein [Deltaproteobacteria bacterium]|nr:putative addiction module antidote protein [Deltaproteobacteria bacterium]
MKKVKNFRQYHLEKLKTLKAARVYLEVALEEFEKDHDKDTFLQAIRDVAEAQGGLSLLAKRAGLNRQNLYKALSARGNPQFDTIGAILQALGFRLSVELLSRKAA